ncbi:hypothetical protein HK101_001403 [Irineochytrium annulatum]|nr:hypothetical protein HK101_001403 [Irineochytrium annulatum]
MQPLLILALLPAALAVPHPQPQLASVPIDPAFAFWKASAVAPKLAASASATPIAAAAVPVVAQVSPLSSPSSPVSTAAPFWKAGPPAWLAVNKAAAESCVESAYDCGPVTANGVGSIVQCIGGTNVQLDECDQPGAGSCQVIGGVPYCVAGSNAAAAPAPSTPTLVVPTPDPVVTPYPSNTPSATDAGAAGGGKGVTPSTSPISKNPAPKPTATPSATPKAPPKPSPAPPPATGNGDGGMTSVGAAPPSAAAQGVSACQYDIILQMTSVFENGTPKLDFGSCANINDGNGYSAGFIQFTTGSGNAQTVVKNYIKDPSANQDIVGQFKGIMDAMNRASGGNVDGLDAFCGLWSKAAKQDTACFSRAQIGVQSDLFFAPDLDIVQSKGLKTATGVGLMFDTAVQLGKDGLVNILANTGGKSPADGGDEAAYLTAVCAAKRNYINKIGGAYPATAYRIESYLHVINGGNLEFDGNAVTMLDNSGGQLPLKANC